MTGPRLSIIPARAATDRALKPRDLQVLCVLGRHTDDLGWCRKSQVKMAEEMGCARSTVYDAVERLVSAGYLERHVQEEDNGRDSPHVYRVILDPKHPYPGVVKDADCEPENPCRLAGTPADRPAPPADISAPPAGPEPAPPAGPGPAPKNDLLRTTHQNEEERENAGARREEHQPEAKAPGRRAFKAGFAKWPTYLTDGDTEALAKFEACTPEERREGLERQAEYVTSAKATGRSQFKDYWVYWDKKLWQRLPPRAPSAEPGTALVAKPWGPAWMQRVLEGFVRGPIDPGPVEMTREKRAAAFAAMREMLGPEKAEAHYRRMGHDIAPDGSLIFPDEFEARVAAEHRAAKGWPAVNALYKAAAEGRSVPLPAGFRLLVKMEAVPVSLRLMAEWRAEFNRRGWPWLPDPGGMRVVFFPAGGPGALDAFERALRREDDAGRVQAAE